MPGLCKSLSDQLRHGACRGLRLDLSQVQLWAEACPALHSALTTIWPSFVLKKPGPEHKAKTQDSSHLLTSCEVGLLLLLGHATLVKICISGAQHNFVFSPITTE